MTFYTYIHDISAKYIFISVCIILICLVYFRRLNINLPIIFGLGVGLIIVYYVIDRRNTKQLDTDQLYDKKLNAIVPKPLDISTHREMIDMLYDIRNYYFDNQQSFEDMIKYINEFFDTYTYGLEHQGNSGKIYNQLEDMKINILNNLFSIEHKIDRPKPSKEIPKFCQQMEKILNNYMNIIYKKFTEEKVMGKINTNTELPHRGARPYNQYNNGYFDYY